MADLISRLRLGWSERITLRHAEGCPDGKGSRRTLLLGGRKGLTEHVFKRELFEDPPIALQLLRR